MKTEPTLINELNGPWIASKQYDMHFILNQSNKIVVRCDNVPFNVLRVMVKAANELMQKRGS